MRPWILGETNYAVTQENPYNVAVLPLGATEPHNFHLPYATDTLIGNAIGERICEAAHKDGGRVVLLPTIPYGTETNMHALPLAMNVNPSTLFQVITDLLKSLVDCGIKKVLLLNCHGGNALKPLLRELCDKSPAHLFLCNWIQMVNDLTGTIFEHQEDHAGEMETSLGLAYFPDLVIHNEDGSLRADAGETRPFRFEALEKEWVDITRPWHLLTTNTGAGNPHESSAEKGQQLMDVLIERLGTFLVELSNSPLDESFPFTDTGAVDQGDAEN